MVSKPGLFDLPENLVDVLVLSFLDAPQVIDSLGEMNGAAHDFPETGEFVLELDILVAFVDILFINFGQGHNLRR